MSIDAVASVLRGNGGKAIAIPGGEGVRPQPARLVLIVLAEHANPEGLSWPSTSTIAAQACLSRRSVIRALNLLLAERLIRKLSSGRGGRVPSTYEVLPKCASCNRFGRNSDCANCATMDGSVTAPSEHATAPYWIPTAPSSDATEPPCVAHESLTGNREPAVDLSPEAIDDGIIKQHQLAARRHLEVVANAHR